MRIKINKKSKLKNKIKNFFYNTILNQKDKTISSHIKDEAELKKMYNKMKTY